MIKRFFIFSFIILLSSLLLYFEGILLFPIAKILLIAISVSTILFFLFRKMKELQNRILLIVFASAFTISLTDLILRPVLADKIWYRPDDRFLHRDYEYPELHRFKKNVEWNGTVYGDLAAISGEKKYRVYREVEFVTDQYGFRNYPVAENDSFDIIALGDSYTYGSGTTQDSIWTSQLEKISGLKVYNLATPGGPWAELMNLQLELPRIKLKKNAKLIWMLFSGNDLDDYYGDPDFKNLKQNKGWRKYWAMVQGWRYRAPIGLLCRRIVTEKKTNSITIYSNHQLAYRYSWDNHDDKFLDKQYRKLFELADQVNQLIQNSDLPLLVLHAESEAECRITIDPDEYYFFGRVFSYCDQRNIDFQSINLSDCETRWWYDDTHWNTSGNGAVAEIIYNEISGDSSLRSP